MNAKYDALRFRVALRRPQRLPGRARGPRIVFHGINKSGSLAMARVLEAAYAEAGRAQEFHSHYRGDASSEADFRRLIETGADSGFFVGHALFGTLALPRAQYRLLTQFRHPLPRVVSCYQWKKRHHLRTIGEAQPFPTLEEWVEATRGRAHSQVAQFAAPHGEGRRAALDAMSDARIQKLARASIVREVDCIGIAEYFEESIFLFAAHCGLEQVPAWRRDNRNRDRTMTWDLPETASALIERVFRQDFLLYDWVLDRFFAQLRAVRLGGDIKAYRAACAEQYKDRLLLRRRRHELGAMGPVLALGRRLRRAWRRA